MPLPIIRYALDPTGVNPDNVVNGEIHTLSTNKIRAIAPSYGPLYTESCSIYDNTTNRLLVRGQDYQFVELLQEATLKFGKEIAELVLILDETVSNQIRINYQVLGGLYQNNASAVINMYETYLLDNRPVDWTNVLNKPFEYPPSLHLHLLRDIYGFEPIIVALERIRNAIVLSDIPAYEELIKWVKSVIAVATEQDIIDANPCTKLLNLDNLLFALDKYNFNGITLTTPSGTTILNVNENEIVYFLLSSTNLPDNTVLYWTIEHITTSNTDFKNYSGVINVVANKGNFNLTIASNPIAEGNEKFRVIIRRNSTSGFIIARTGIITIGEHKGYTFIDFILAPCMFNPDTSIQPESLYLTRGY